MTLACQGLCSRKPVRDEARPEGDRDEDRRRRRAPQQRTEERGGNIRRVGHDRIFANSGAKSATIVFEVETPDDRGGERIRDALRAAGFEVAAGISA